MWDEAYVSEDEEDVEKLLVDPISDTAMKSEHEEDSYWKVIDCRCNRK